MLLCDLTNTVNFDKMLFWKKCWKSVTLIKCCLVLPSILLTLKKWYFVKVLFCDSANAIDFKKVLLWTSVTLWSRQYCWLWRSYTLSKCNLVIPPIMLTLKKCYFEQVLLCDPANTVDFEKVILCQSVTFTCRISWIHYVVHAGLILMQQKKKQKTVFLSSILTFLYFISLIIFKQSSINEKSIN